MPPWTLALLLALGADPAAAPAPAATLDLPAVLTRARRQPLVEAARASAREAHAKAQEVGRTWWPQIELTLVGGPSQRLQCFDAAGNRSTEQCITTEPNETRLGFDGVFGRADGTLTMPLYTFGKLTAGRKAAEAGAQAHDALAVQSEHDAVLDAARAYFAVKLGRELGVMLEEGLVYVKDELEREEKLLEEGSADVTEADRRRVLSLLAEIGVRRSEARKIEELGLAGIHAALGAEGVTLDAAPLLPIDWTLPERDEVRALAQRRPEARAAASGLEAARQLVELEESGWYPDFVLAGQGRFARSTSVDHPQNAFLSDPYNATSGALGIVLRWKPELATRSAKVAQAEAAAARAQAMVERARLGLPADAERVWSEARDARDRMAASEQGQKHARAWLASILQSEAAGLAEPKDLADALLQYFSMRARLIQATFDWNVAVIGLHRVTGVLHDALTYREED